MSLSVALLFPGTGSVALEPTVAVFDKVPVAVAEIGAMTV